MKLEIGAGTSEREGFIRTDIQARHNIHVVCDARQPLPFKQQFDHIIMWGVFEHFTRKEAEAVLTHCWNALEPNGVLEFTTPDLDAVCKMQMERHFPVEDQVYDDCDMDTLIMGCLYGGQDNEYMYHKWAWTEDTIGELLVSLGYSIPEIDRGSAYEPGTHMHIFARKEK